MYLVKTFLVHQIVLSIFALGYFFLVQFFFTARAVVRWPDRTTARAVHVRSCAASLFLALLSFKVSEGGDRVYCCVCIRYSPPAVDVDCLRWFTHIMRRKSLDCTCSVEAGWPSVCCVCCISVLYVTHSIWDQERYPQWLRSDCALASAFEIRLCVNLRIWDQWCSVWLHLDLRK